MADSFEEYPELTEELKNGTLTTKAINDDPMLIVKELSISNPDFQWRKYSPGTLVSVSLHQIILSISNIL
jgi:hypothetical protein